MPSTGIDGDELLEYNSQYRVLICRQCKYAIQKSAIRSHLLRHKIFRGNRQSLLSRIVRLDLLEPEQVSIPASTSPAIQFLPVISGLRCVFVDCGRLCASLKRMRRHWNEEHGLAESTAGPSILSREVKLQTFFRGTKIRYFEVESESPVSLFSDISSAKGNEGASLGGLDDVTPNTSQTGDVVCPREIITKAQNTQAGVRDALSPSRASSFPTVPDVTPGLLPLAVNLEALTYFHHFITSTSITLPPIVRHQGSDQQWQTEAVALSLQHRELMTGLLAIAAAHEAYLAKTVAARRIHFLRYRQFRADSCRDSAYHDGQNPRAEGQYSNPDVSLWRMHIQSLCQCLDLTLSRSHAARGHLEPPLVVDLHGLLRLFEALTQSESVVDSDTTDWSFKVEEGLMVLQASTLLERSGTPGQNDLESSTAAGSSLQVTLEFIDQLAQRISEAIGKPDNVRDVFATLAALESLRDCCITGLANDDVHTIWRGLSAWWTGLSEHFRNLLLAYQPAPLLVLTCWTGTLLQRAEARGCWYLNGLASVLFLEIAKQLPPGNSAVQSLLKEMKGMC